VRVVALAVALVAAALLTLAAAPIHAQAARSPRGGECIELYFMNSIQVYNTSFSGVLYLETPQNISFGGGLVQRVHVLVSHNLVFDNATHYMKFVLKKGEKFFGYFVARVQLCGVNMTRMSRLEALALADPYKFKPVNASIPRDVAARFLGKTPRIVEEVARPAFERWFSKVLGAPPSNFSKLVLALYLAQFVKSWIHYKVSPYPRPLKVIVEKRIGDCDDMSRLLIALLWSYGIPAVMADGYVVIWGLHYKLPVESTLYVFYNSGPHAFVLAYVPRYGWIPIDSGSLTVNPFIFEGYTTQIIVNETAVKEFKNVSKQINATQIFYVFNPLQYQLVAPNLHQFVEKLYAPYNATERAILERSRTATSSVSIGGVEVSPSTPATSASTVTSTVYSTSVRTVTATVPLAQRTTITSVSTVTVTSIRTRTVYTTSPLPLPELVALLAAILGLGIGIGLLIHRAIRR